MRRARCRRGVPATGPDRQIPAKGPGAAQGGCRIVGAVTQIDPSLGDQPPEAAQDGPQRDSDVTTSEQTGAATRITRRGILAAFAATAVAAAPTYSKAAGFLRGSGDIRRLRMTNPRTGERMDTIYWLEGRYLRDAMAEVNFFFRDWRRNESKDIDDRTLDIIAATHNLLDADDPFILLSGYRSPETNRMLRARSGGVATRSLHLVGQAADLRLASRSVRQVAQAAASCAAGGVGRYSGSDFTHVDCGTVRSWGR
jgi:uncharacterized protein YcbK (DUF882 family)